MRLIAFGFLLHLLAGCAGWTANAAKPGHPMQQSAVAVRGPGVPLELQWFRDSAERPMVYSEVYAQAAQSVTRMAAQLTPGSWAVILDIDETILDNSEYQARLALSGQNYSPATWDAWVHEKKAVALPGAVAFLHTVRGALHGRVVLVSNRSLADCTDTEANLHQQRIEYDAILCAPNGPNGQPVSDKNPRFAAVRDGATPLGTLQVVAYIGDNIQDFPGLSQADPGDGSHFGKDFFILPNPMYGSWVGTR